MADNFSEFDSSEDEDDEGWNCDGCNLCEKRSGEDGVDDEEDSNDEGDDGIEDGENANADAASDIRQSKHLGGKEVGGRSDHPTGRTSPNRQERNKDVEDSMDNRDAEKFCFCCRP